MPAWYSSTAITATARSPSTPGRYRERVRERDGRAGAGATGAGEVRTGAVMPAIRSQRTPQGDGAGSRAAEGGDTDAPDEAW
jgi:hypothetical protein